MKLARKTAVITGATGGIGRELVKNLDEEGMQLVLISKTESELSNLKKNLNGKNHKYFVCDLTRQDEAIETARLIAGEYDTLDILINAAGIGVYKPIEEVTMDEWNKSLAVNVSAGFIFTKFLMPSLTKTDDSCILNIGSGMGKMPTAERSVYCTTKYALRGLSLSLSEEFARVKSPKVILITLGSVLTSFGPLSLETKKDEMESGKAYLTPESVAEKILEIIKSDKKESEYEFYPSDYVVQ